MTPPPRVAVILLVHNDYAQRYLAACAEGLKVQTYPAERFSVFLVSNGVSPESRQLVARLMPDARILHNARNLGWTGGNNTAIRVALPEGFEYVVILNVDTVVDRDWLAALVEAARAQPDIHILQSTILLHGTSRINSIGNRIHYLGHGYCQGYGAAYPLPTPAVIDYASGAAMLVKREVFERIGLFRDPYFIYCDDMEFCWRARLAGFRVGLAERSICHHKYEFQSKLDALYLLQRNRLTTLLTLERLRTLLLIGPCLVVAELVLSLYLIAIGKGGVPWKLAAHFARAQTWRAIRATRREIEALRVRRDAEIVKGFAATIVFAEIDSPVFRYLVNPLLQLYWTFVKPLIRW
jgi:hypothetical protein